ncbi:hypothetical protein ANO11243_017100 [Dothideomycetidae sp. 11243]|nr:hypothetical protein ANO11243_017100 [fungal sp. No.11243]
MASDRDVLPSSVRPTNYNLSIHDLELGGSWSYQGTLKIDVEVKSETKDVVLNAFQLKIHGAEAQTEQGKTEGSIKTNNISYDEKNQRATLHFDQAIPQSHKAVITVTFQGTMNGDMAGFYRSKYKPTGEVSASVPKDDQFHYMFSTQFESSDARRAFPCFDEPNLKASLEFEIEIPEDQTALSNMPESEIKKSKKSGFKVVAFEKSPVMSTYLYAWAFGDFEYIEDFTRRKYNGKNLPVRVYSTKGLISQGKLALESAHQIVDYFSEIFKIDYPLPKVDLLAVHEFSHGAMENWGLITYRTTALLFDEQTSDQVFKNRVVYVVAHELAHQWFGNLVTMDWWNELWLNEGFATWVGWYAVDHLHPDWNVWAQFVTEGMQSAFKLDSLRTSHPIEVPVKNALEVDQIFDAISYLKGSSVIRMLAAHLTPEVFLQGVADYLQNHKFGNAKTVDLWNALSKASGQDVNDFMDPWIRKIGFPVVTVAEEPGQIGVRQTRFLDSGDVKPEEDTTTWWVPLGLKSGESKSQTHDSALTSKEDTVRDVDDSFYKVNADQTGFYRTNLPAQRLTKLASQLDRLSIEDRIGLIGDAAALAASGDATTAGLLTFLEGFSHESSSLVWSEIVASLGNIRSIFADDAEIAEGLRQFTLKLVTPATEKIGWEFKQSDDFLTGQLRTLLIAAAGLAGHEATVSEAQKRFKAYFDGDKKAIHPSLRRAVFQIGIKEGGKEAYELVRKEYETTSSVDGKVIALTAMGRVQTKELAHDLMKWTFSGAVAMQDVYSPSTALAANPKVRIAVWEFIKSDWQLVWDRLSGNMVTLERFLRMALNKFASHEIEQDITKFFESKDQAGYDRGLAVISASISGQAKYRERDAEVIREWLKAHGYTK